MENISSVYHTPDCCLFPDDAGTPAYHKHRKSDDLDSTTRFPKPAFLKAKHTFGGNAHSRRHRALLEGGHCYKRIFHKFDFLVNHSLFSLHVPVLHSIHRAFLIICCFFLIQFPDVYWILQMKKGKYAKVDDATHDSAASLMSLILGVRENFLPPPPPTLNDNRSI